jgi:hypothetical protein
VKYFRELRAVFLSIWKIVANCLPLIVGWCSQHQVLFQVDQRLPKAARLNFAGAGVFLVFLRSLSLLDVLEREYLSDFIVICPK